MGVCHLRSLYSATGSWLYSRETTRRPEGFSGASRQCFAHSAPVLMSGTVPSPSEVRTPRSTWGRAKQGLQRCKVQGLPLPILLVIWKC